MVDIKLLITSIVVMVGLGMFVGLGLSIAYRKLKVEEDAQLKKILEILPGLNCGACGYASCEEFAKKLMEGEAPIDACKVGGEKVTKRLETTLGKSNSSVKKDVQKARLKCNARDFQKTKVVDYYGLRNCLSANALGSSGFACFEGCLGFGDCAAVCPVSAIEMKEGRPQINLSKCIGCGLCVESCPRGLIDLVYPKGSAKELIVVGCNCTQMGAVTRKMCEVGCIACGKCIKICPVGAISLREKKALVDPSKCIACGKCVEVCPTKAIYVTKTT
jgi:Na+-translocating ferredoxin:NAD+ oxidoreductase RNF subunit RnfB